MKKGGSHEDTKARREGFPTRRLKFAASINDEALPDTTDPDYELKYIDIGNVDSSGTIKEAAVYTFSKAPSRARRRVKHGDVIVSTVRTYLQAIAPIIEPEDDLIVSTGFAVARPNSSLLESNYFKYALRESRFISEVVARSSGISYPAINSSELACIPIHLPPPPTQHRIAEYLDRETARIDALVEAKESMLQLLEQKRAALISRAVTRGLNPNAPTKPSGLDWLGEIPEHWRIQRLKQLADVRGGLTLGKRYTGDLLEFPYLRVANVQDGFLKLDNVTTVEVPLSEGLSNLLKDGDVLMNEGGDIDKLGRGCVWRDQIKPCLHQNHVFAVRPHAVDSDWLALWTSTLEAKRYFESRAKRSTNLASISGTNIKEFPVLLPPRVEQVTIQAFLAEKQSRFDKVSEALRDSITLLKERRSALITAAVTGQIPLEEMTA